MSDRKWRIRREHGHLSLSNGEGLDAVSERRGEVYEQLTPGPIGLQ
jgi:hypothetical protein